jgi:hypothetical protein
MNLLPGLRKTQSHISHLRIDRGAPPLVRKEETHRVDRGTVNIPALGCGPHFDRTGDNRPVLGLPVLLVAVLLLMLFGALHSVG